MTSGPNRQKLPLFASLWWRLSLSSLIIAFLALSALVLAAAVVSDVRRGVVSLREADLPRLGLAFDLAESAMHIAALRGALDGDGAAPEEDIRLFRQRLEGLSARVGQLRPSLAEDGIALDKAVTRLQALADEAEEADRALRVALQDLRWLNIDLEGELDPLSEDLRFDIETRVDQQDAPAVGQQLARYDTLQDLDTFAGAAVTLMLQAATTTDRAAFDTLRVLIDDTMAEARLREARLPDRIDYQTLRQTLELLQEHAVSERGVLSRRIAYLDLRGALSAQVREVQDRTEALHDALLVAASAERDGVLAATETRTTRATGRLNLMGLAGAAVVLLVLVVLFGFFRRGVVGPLVQLSTALRSIAAGKADVPVPHYGPSEVGEMAAAVREFRGAVTAREEANQLLAEEVARHKATLQELRETQADLVQAAKLATLGELSAGLNHELNQPLMSLQHRIRTLQEMLGETPEPARGDIRARVGQLGELVQRSIATVQHLKRFTRKASPQARTPVNLHEAARGAESLIRYRLRNAGVSLEIAEDLGRFTALGDTGLIEQVLLNLFANALEAVEARDGLDGAEVLVRARRALGGGVELVVADSGVGLQGMSPEDAMAPFVTSKPAGEGLGLGLSLSRKIMEELGGSLALRPRAGGGTEAVMTLQEAEP